jgi:S1-C subfamily serine protease
MEKHRVGDRVTVEILRNNKRQSIEVVLQAVN